MDSKRTSADKTNCDTFLSLLCYNLGLIWCDDMFGMLKGVTEVVSGVTVTVFVSDRGGSWDHVTGCHSGLVTASWWQSLLWLVVISPSLAGTEQHQAPGLSLDHYLLIWSQSQHLGQNFKLIHFVGDAEFYYGHICGQRSAPSVWDVTGGYVLYQIRLLPFSRVISHNILITIVNLSTLSFESVIWLFSLNMKMI